MRYPTHVVLIGKYVPDGNGFSSAFQIPCFSLSEAEETVSKYKANGLVDSFFEAIIVRYCDG